MKGKHERQSQGDIKETPYSTTLHTHAAKVGSVTLYKSEHDLTADSVC